MHLTATQAGAYLAVLRPLVAEVVDRDPFIRPASPSIFVARDRLNGANARWCAKDVHPGDRGKHTGDVSAPTLVDLPLRFVEVGHAERWCGPEAVLAQPLPHLGRSPWTVAAAKLERVAIACEPGRAISAAGVVDVGGS